MPSWTYLVADLRSNVILGELPLKQPSFTTLLNGAGDFEGKVPLGSAAVQAMDIGNLSSPARTALYVDRDGVLVWGGIIWHRDYDSPSQTLDLKGAEFASYYSRRRLKVSRVYAAEDSLAAVRDVLAALHAQAGGDIGITLGAELSGVLLNATYNWWEFKPGLEIVQELAAMDNGFDFAVDVAYDALHVPTKSMRLSYPRRGRTLAATGLTLELPGPIVKYRWPEDGMLMADSITGIGSGSESSMLTATVANTTLIDAGYPLLEDTQSYRDVTDLDRLRAMTQADAWALAAPVVVPEVTVRADRDPVIGSYICGDDARLRITDARFPSGLDARVRIVGWTLHPGDDQEETVDLKLGSPGLSGPAPLPVGI